MERIQPAMNAPLEGRVVGEGVEEVGDSDGSMGSSRVKVCGRPGAGLRSARRKKVCSTAEVPDMSTQPPRPRGSIVGQDLTVKDAERVREFYARVAGWLSTEVEMGGYSDYNMHDAEGTVVAGICHAAGPNAKVPPQWLVYITVEDADVAAEHAVEAGGAIIDGPRSMGDGTRFVVVKDPAGACCALISKAD